MYVCSGKGFHHQAHTRGRHIVQGNQHDVLSSLHSHPLWLGVRKLSTILPFVPTNFVGIVDLPAIMCALGTAGLHHWVEWRFQRFVCTYVYECVKLIWPLFKFTLGIGWLQKLMVFLFVSFVCIFAQASVYCHCLPLCSEQQQRLVYKLWRLFV